MANGNDKKKSLLDYFGMKSRDGDEALSAAQDSLRLDRETEARKEALEFARRDNAKNIEAVLVKYLMEENKEREKRNRADMILAGRKDKRYENPGVFNMNQGFTESDPDTLRARFGREEDEFEMIVNQLLGRSRPTAYQGGDMISYFDKLDEPTKKIIQMLLDDYQGKEKFEGLKLD